MSSVSQRLKESNVQSAFTEHCCSYHGHCSWASMSVSPVSGSSSSSVPQCRMAPCSAEQQQQLRQSSLWGWGRLAPRPLSSSFHSDSSVVALSATMSAVWCGDTHLCPRTVEAQVWRRCPGQFENKAQEYKTPKGAGDVLNGGACLSQMLNKTIYSKGAEKMPEAGRHQDPSLSPGPT